MLGFSSNLLRFNKMLRLQKQHWCFFIIVIFFSKISCAQQLSSEELKLAAQQKFNSAVFDLKSFLSLPNDGHFPDQVSNNLNWCDSVFTALDFDLKKISTNGAPLLFAEKIVHRKAKTVLFYLQIDGQPVDRSKLLMTGEYSQDPHLIPKGQRWPL